ncbi:MAG: hypothetical protein AB7V23_08485 [Candidatus Nanopelagicales bacterium]
MAQTESQGFTGPHWDDEGVARELFVDVAGMAPYERSSADLLDLHLRALADQLESRRRSIPVLDQRATDAGVSKPTSLHDVAPLLLPHHVYKSYPQSFIDKGRWDGMNRWYGTLSALDHAEVDVSGVHDIDGWIAAMDAAGRGMFVTSGTTGKAGFLPISDRDKARNTDIGTASFRNFFRFPEGARVPTFILAPAQGPQKTVNANRNIAATFGDPDATYFLFDDADSVATTNRIGAIRTASNNGTVRPEDLAEVQAIQLAKRDLFEQRMAWIADRIQEHLDRPMLVKGFWSQMTQLVDLLVARGVRPGSLAPGSFVFTGGGKKADSLPEGFEQKVRSFFAGTRVGQLYAMSEILHQSYPCAADRYHLPMGVMPILLDEPGERALDRVDGVMEGRLALHEFGLRDRWGGVITSDWVTIDFATCSCGLASASLVDVRRITQGADDKLTCAGTIDAYVRDIVGA